MLRRGGNDVQKIPDGGLCPGQPFYAIRPSSPTGGFIVEMEQKYRTFMGAAGQ